MRPKIVTLLPAYNEEESIGATIESLLAQTWEIDRIVLIPNGCTDSTAEICRSYERQHDNIVVLELPKLKQKKPEALNRGWAKYGQDADFVISLDADTYFPPNTVEGWLIDFGNADSLHGALPGVYPLIGGFSSKATMPKQDIFGRLQAAEFAEWTDTGLIRGYTTVLPGTGCMIRGEALRQVVINTTWQVTSPELDDNLPARAPWSHTSAVEDFELTTRIRKAGYVCKVSPRVRVMTDSMDKLKPLWSQRLKWAGGTVEELLDSGFNRLTMVDWGQQALGFFMLAIRLFWAALIVAQAVFGVLQFHWFWWLVYPMMFACAKVYLATRIPNYNRKDILLAATFVPHELFGWLRVGWFTVSWCDVLWTRITGREKKDRWALQYKAEGI